MSALIRRYLSVEDQVLEVSLYKEDGKFSILVLWLFFVLFQSVSDVFLIQGYHTGLAYSKCGLTRVSVHVHCFVHVNKRSINYSKISVSFVYFRCYMRM